MKTLLNFRPRLQLRLVPAVCALGVVALALKIGVIVGAIGNAAVGEAQAAGAPAKDQPTAQVLPPAAPRPLPAPAQQAGETELLQGLADRRAELERREVELREREALLQATEKRIEEKIAKVQQIEKATETAQKAKDEEEEARLKSLVKIYETMKPKEAARVFEQLEMKVLLQVMERMKEGKSAPILAAMEPAKAKQVTMALAERKPPVQASAK